MPCAVPVTTAVLPASSLVMGTSVEVMSVLSSMSDLPDNAEPYCNRPIRPLPGYCTPECGRASERVISDPSDNLTDSQSSSAIHLLFTPRTPCLRWSGTSRTVGAEGSWRD